MSGSSNPTGSQPAKRPRWKRFLQNLGLSMATFLVCMAAFEGFLRLEGYGNLEIYQPDPKLYWKLKPDQDCYTKIDHKPVHINSHGTRGPEFQTEKPPSTLRIVSLGDSRTFGWGLSDAETYSQRLEKSLQPVLAGGRQVEVINAGVNAWSFPQMFVYFRETVVKYHPDIVIVGDANGWTQFSEKNSPEFVQQFMRRVRLKNFLRRFAIYHFVVEVELREFYDKNRTKFIPVDPNQDPLYKEQQQTNYNAVFRSAIEELCRLAQTNHIQPILLYLPTADSLATTNLNAVLKIKQDIHDQWNVPLVDITPDVKPGAKSLYLDADPVHFNPRGSEIIARRLFETVTNLMTDEQAGHH